MKNIIFFRTDRLGDFLIITNIIKALKDKYPKSKITVVASQMNYHFIKKFKIIDRVILFNKNYSFLKKIDIFKIINDRHYDVSFSIDGKSFSNLCTFFLNSKIKLGLIYKSNIFGIPLYKPNLLFKIIFNYYETFTSKKNLLKIEHLPTKLINLANKLSFKIKNKDKYYFIPTIKEKEFKKRFSKNITKKFVLIHLDEKWNDIKNIEAELFENLFKFQRSIKMNLIITAKDNRYMYFKKLKYSLNRRKNSKIILLNNINLDILERLINYSAYSISCHSGFLVQIAGCNKTKIIDIINKKDLMWYSCWKPLNTKHKFVFKSNYEQKFNIKRIFNNIVKISKNF